MAAHRRRSSAGRRPASRARSGARGGARGRRAPPRGGGGMGAGPIVTSICILLLGIVGIIFILKEDDKKPEKPDRNTNVVRQPDKPVKKLPDADPFEGRGIPPEPTQDQWKRARSVAGQMQNMLKKVKRLQKESVEAKQAGDNDTWQDKMSEAVGVRDEMRELWNEIIADLPTNDKWDQEQVANYHFGVAYKPLADADKALAGSDKIRR